MHTIDSQTSASQNYTSTEKVVSVAVWEQFHGFTGTYDLLTMRFIICVVGSYSLEIMITNKN